MAGVVVERTHADAVAAFPSELDATSFEKTLDGGVLLEPLELFLGDLRHDYA